MDSLIALLCIVAGGYFCFRHGKQLGSRKAFGIGYRRARKRFHRKVASRKR